MTDRQDEPRSPGNDAITISHLAALAAQSERQGLLWTNTSDDLNTNLLLFTGGNGVDEHVNSEVDVLVVGVFGEGAITIDGVERPFAAGDVAIVPKGAARSFRAGKGRLAYLTCHRRRGGLWPSVPVRTSK